MTDKAYINILALDIARAEAQNRVRETDGKNDSPRIREYGKVVGIEPPEPWCAAFVCWCIHEAAKHLRMPDPIEYSAYTPTLLSRCQRLHSKKDQIKPSDLFFVYNQRLKRISHVGFVASPLDSDGWFNTVEGNTNVARPVESRRWLRISRCIFLPCKNIGQLCSALVFEVPVPFLLLKEEKRGNERP